MSRRNRPAHDSFQSTLSVRRATDTQTTAMRAILISIHALRKESDGLGFFDERFECISIHALRKESDPSPLADPGRLSISIHALRKESDRHIIQRHAIIIIFQSTLSVRRAT